MLNVDGITKNNGRSLVGYGSGHMPATAIAPERNDAAGLYANGQ